MLCIDNEMYKMGNDAFTNSHIRSNNKSSFDFNY